MTAQLLTNELTNLIQDSKRKHGELRSAAEQSLQDLKALPFTSEAQLAADLIRKPDFSNPFFLACETRTARYAGSGVVCLQRLVASRALPKEKLKDVLAAFREITSLGLDVQLRILQTLPALLQYYATELQGDQLGTTLQICTIIQASKTPAVGSSAAATLQQLVMAVFERLAEEDEMVSQGNSIVDEATLGDEVVPLHASTADAFRILNDLCLMADGGSAELLNWKGLSQTFALELIESILTDHPELFFKKPELASLLRLRLVTLLIKIVSERTSFAISVRGMRVLHILLKRHLQLLPSECEMAHSLLTHLLEQDAAPAWKRAMCMELYRSLFSEPALIRLMYAVFDDNDERQNVVQNLLAMFARLASEKPAVIGLGRQSTIPVDRSLLNEASEERAILEAAGVAGVIGAPTEVSDVVPIGISSQLSSVRVACIDQLDKSEPSNLPASYIYGLVLNCITSLFEGIAKFLLPLTVPGEGRAKRRHRAEGSIHNDVEVLSDKPDARISTQSQMPINPLELYTHPQIEDIQKTAALIELGWAPMLAACSTYLYATLDSDYFHNLVRSFQKLTHVAGLLRLAVPRDAFLTLLAKAALPSNPSSVIASLSPSTPRRIPSSPGLESKDGTLEIPSTPSTPLSPDKPVHPNPNAGPVLTTRNLLCLRALLNLGIALGPTFSEAAWKIVLETLRDGDIIISTVERELLRKNPRLSSDGRPGSSSDSLSNRASINTEISAVQSAQTRLLESTLDYPSEPFLCMLRAIFGLVADEEADTSAETAKDQVNTSIQALPLKPHQNKRSISLTVSKISLLDQEWMFALKTLSDLTRINASRLVNVEPEESGWDILTTKLVAFTSQKSATPSFRMHAGEVLNNMIIATIRSASALKEERRRQNQLRSLLALKAEVATLRSDNVDNSSSVNTKTHVSDNEVHGASLEALHTILEQCGESLLEGWEIVFELVSTVFPQRRKEHQNKRLGKVESLQDEFTSKSQKLVRSAFNSLRLICSDFLPSLPLSCFLSVVRLLYQFCSQQLDFNLSLTTTTFFWSVADFLKGRCSYSILSDVVTDASDEDHLSAFVNKTDSETSNAALWLLLLLHLVQVTRDGRAEIRNGATQTLLRIFDACGEQLSSKAWNTCLDLILFKMIDFNTTMVASMVLKSLDTWNETVIVMITGLSKLFSNFLESISRHSQFSVSWNRLLSTNRSLLDRKSLKVSHAVFAGLYQVLQSVREVKSFDMNHSKQAWEVWNDGRPRKHYSDGSDTSIQQNALVAFVQTMETLYDIIGKELTIEQITSMLDNLQACVMDADLPPYSSDVDYLSPIQEEVFKCISLMRMDNPKVPSAVIFHLADLVNAPFIPKSAPRDGKKPTFIAVSKRSIDMLGKTCSEHVKRFETIESGALTVSIQALGNVVEKKHRWELNEKVRAPWREATTAVLDIVQTSVPIVHKESREKDKLIQFWKSIVRLTADITSSDPTIAVSVSDQLSDEDFDVETFTRLQAAIIPALGDAVIPDVLRRYYASALFTASLIHPPPSLSDLPPLPSAPLKDLYVLRLGCTVTVSPTLRTKMSYTVLSSLFSLVATPVQDDGERVALAQATAPFLILRAALPLKNYIVDQPLRGGFMPQPKSQMKELLWLLDKLIELKSEAKALAEPAGLKTTERRHLVRLFPLMQQALSVEGGAEVSRRLRTVVEVVGAEFGDG